MNKLKMKIKTLFKKEEQIKADFAVKKVIYVIDNLDVWPQNRKDWVKQQCQSKEGIHSAPAIWAGQTCLMDKVGQA